MKIKKSRVFEVDIHEVTSAKTSTVLEGDVTIRSYNYADRRVSKCTVVIKFGCNYVPVYHCKNILEFLDLSTHVSKDGGVNYPDVRFLSTSPGAYCRIGQKFVKDVKPLFQDNEGKISLKELVGIQKEHYDKDDTFAPIC